MSEMAVTLSAVSIIVSAASVALVFIRNTKELEGRLSSLEATQITPEERGSLKDTSIKMTLFRSIVENEFPKLLKQHNTAELDGLLDKAINNNLTMEEQHRLLDLLNDEYTIAVKTENSGRAMALALYRGALAFSNNIPGLCVHY